MKYMTGFSLASLLFFSCFVPAAVAQSKTVRIKTPEKVPFSSGISHCPPSPKPYIRRTNPLSRKDELERLMSRSKPGTPEYFAYLQEREEIALSEIHDAQRFLIDERADRIPKKKREVEELMKSEWKVLEPAVRLIGDFPFANRMDDIRKLVWDIKYGKINFGDCKGKTNSRILRKIQDEQVKSLRNFHKKQNGLAPRI